MSENSPHVAPTVVETSPTVEATDAADEYHLGHA